MVIGFFQNTQHFSFFQIAAALAHRNFHAIARQSAHEIASGNKDVLFRFVRADKPKSLGHLYHHRLSGLPLVRLIIAVPFLLNGSVFHHSRQSQQKRLGLMASHACLFLQILCRSAAAARPLQHTDDVLLKIRPGRQLFSRSARPEIFLF